MSKLALINRQYKREKLVAKYAKKRAALEAMVANSRMSDEDRYAARLKLQALPRNANPTRLRNRCLITGRPRGVYQQVRPRAQQVARIRDARRSPRHRQSQLVGVTELDEHD